MNDERSVEPAPEAEALVARLTELELRYTEQQALLQELSEVIYGQQRELDSLRAELQQLRGRLAESDVGPGEKPPHY